LQSHQWNRKYIGIYSNHTSLNIIQRSLNNCITKPNHQIHSEIGDYNRRIYSEIGD
jgi:hypothetical protein